MKQLIATLLLTAVMCLAGCSDKEAREYAAKLIPVLDSYQEQLTQKIKAEQASYEELADTYDEARKDDIKIRLSTERLRRSEVLGEEIANASNAPKLSQILDQLQEYAKLDFETTQSLLDDQVDSRSKYLTDLESLEIELQKIKALKEALQELAKSKTDFKKFKGEADFLTQTDKGIDQLLCADLKKQLEQLNADKAALKKQLEGPLSDAEKAAVGDKIKKTELKIAQTTERSAARKCP